MVRGVASPAPPILPQVSFVKIQDDSSAAFSGTHDLQARSYGYNDFSDFRRPEHYIRHIEPLESELAVQVEYDMDEQDKEWLDAVNAERKKEQLNPVTYETFEIIVDRLEKEWFDLTKNIPKHDFALPSEDSTCAICDDSEGENSNAIVFCDGCNLAVHQDCYGVPYIPEGQWLCRKCTVSPENPVSCILCPNEGGAFKQTVLGDWVHLLCAIWVPETRVANEVFMEPITGVERISKQRWKLKCSICDIREGACIQCAKTSCFLAFHATCARKQKLLMPMKSHGAEIAALTAFCEKHLPLEQQKIRRAAIESGQLEDDIGNSAKLSKTARAYAKTYKQGPPLVPNIIVERIQQYIGKVIIRKKPDFVLLLCKYWSLKREARRGAPLLKRLHLEPWTASNVNKHHTEQEKTMKLELLRRLRKDLESVRAMTELSRKRESRKLKQAEIVRDVLDCFLFSREAALRPAFDKIVNLDRSEHFRHPVSKVEVPDYFDIVKNPMCWTVIEGKIDRHEYWDLKSFKDDVQLVLDNAMLYNKSGTPYYKAALKLQTSSKPIMEELDRLSRLPVVPHIPNGDVVTPEHPPIGDLEPDLEVLKLLLSKEAIQDNVDLVINPDPLTSLLNFETAEYKPAPASPPRPVPPKKGRPVKGKRKLKNILKAVDTAALDASSGFKSPRTRRFAARGVTEDMESRGFAVPTPAPTTSKRGRRSTVTLPGQLDAPLVVEDVDNQQSFKFFNAGWILPSTQRRGGRAPVERGALPAPGKRTKPSSTLHAQPNDRDSDNVERQEVDAQVDDDQGQPTDGEGAPEPPLAHHGRGTRKRPPLALDLDDPSLSTVIQQPNGSIVVEIMDTPAIRRAKAQRRKQFLAAEAAAANATAAVTASEPAPTSAVRLDALPSRAGPSVLPEVDANADMESELSSLTGAEYDSHGERDASPGITRREGEGFGDLRHAATGPINEALDSLTTPWPPPIELPLEGGTLVWAKADTFPWWPAVIFEEDDEEIPRAVLQAKKNARKGHGPLQLVRFFDKKLSWKWVGPESLVMFGDKELDQELLANPSRRQKWKNATIRQECQVAWELATSEMEVEEETATATMVAPTMTDMGSGDALDGSEAHNDNS